MQRSGKFPLEKLCTTYPWQDMERALEDIKSGKVSFKRLLRYHLNNSLTIRPRSSNRCFSGVSG